MDFPVTMHSDTPQDAVLQVSYFLAKESRRLNRLADLTTGVAKKELIAQAAYAHQVSTMLATLTVEPARPALSLEPGQ